MGVEELQEMHFGSLDAPPLTELLRRCRGFLVGSPDGSVGIAQVVRHTLARHVRSFSHPR
jgi:hypothetical protein